MPGDRHAGISEVNMKALARVRDRAFQRCATEAADQQPTGSGLTEQPHVRALVGMAGVMAALHAVTTAGTLLACDDVPQQVRKAPLDPQNEWLIERQPEPLGLVLDKGFESGLVHIAGHWHIAPRLHAPPANNTACSSAFGGRTCLCASLPG
jgi:hypothetical protein